MSLAVICRSVHTLGMLAASWRSYKMLRAQREFERDAEEFEQRTGIDFAGSGEGGAADGGDFFQEGNEEKEGHFSSSNSSGGGAARRRLRSRDSSDLGERGGGRLRPSPSVAEVEVLWLRKRELSECRHSLLSYWASFAFFSLYDVYAEFLFSWFPLYYLTKTTLLLWIVVPEAKGAVVFFEHFISPWFRSLQHKIETKGKPFVRKILAKYIATVHFMWSRNFPRLVTSRELNSMRTSLEDAVSKADEELRRRRRGAGSRMSTDSEEWSEISAPSSPSPVPIAASARLDEYVD